MGSRGAALAHACVSDAGAKFDREVVLDAAAIVPQVTWGTSPEMVTTIEGRVPDPDKEKDPIRRESMERALAYMGLAAEHGHRPTSRSTRCSSVRAPIRASRICAPRRRSFAGGARPTASSSRWSCPDRGR